MRPRALLLALINQVNGYIDSGVLTQEERIGIVAADIEELR